MVLPLGLEPRTPCLEDRCSIQLSYESKKKENPPQDDWHPTIGLHVMIKKVTTEDSQLSPHAFPAWLWSQSWRPALLELR